MSATGFWAAAARAAVLGGAGGSSEKLIEDRSACARKATNIQPDFAGTALRVGLEGLDWRFMNFSSA